MMGVLPIGRLRQWLGQLRPGAIDRLREHLDRQAAEAQATQHQLARRIEEAQALLQVLEQRTRHLVHQNDASRQLLEATEARTRTLEAVGLRLQLALDHVTSTLLGHDLAWARQAGLPDGPAARRARAIRLDTRHPVAVDSADHLLPQSTAEGVVRPQAFVSHCLERLGDGLRCLDLGAGAGGLVCEFTLRDVLALGLDGADTNLRHRAGYWPLLPDNLRTCDITHPFRLEGADGQRCEFELVTAWEVLEHIPEPRLAGLLANVKAHLAPGGWFAGSVSLLEYRARSGQPYHVTLHPRDWWARRFLEAGLDMTDDGPLDRRQFPRGNGPRFQDFHNYLDQPQDGFHFMARHAPGAP